MTVNTLVFSTTETIAKQQYANPIAVRFFENLEQLASELTQTGKISFSSMVEIIGKEPVIVDSPDNDARLEAYEEIIQFHTQASNIASLIETYAKKNKKIN